MIRRLGAKVAHLRRERQLTQRALAERAGLSRGYVCQIERGRRATTVDSVVALADALGVRPETLLQ